MRAGDNVDRKKVMQRLDQLEPRTWYIEDLTETDILIYSAQGVEEAIQNSGIEYIKRILQSDKVPENVKDKIREYFEQMSKGR